MEFQQLTFTSDIADKLFEMLDIKETKCKYCGKELQRKDIGGLMPPGNIILCKSIFCMSEWMIEYPKFTDPKPLTEEEKGYLDYAKSRKRRVGNTNIKE